MQLMDVLFTVIGKQSTRDLRVTGIYLNECPPSMYARFQREMLLWEKN